MYLSTDVGIDKSKCLLMRSAGSVHITLLDKWVQLGCDLFRMMARSALKFDVGVFLQTTLTSNRKGFENGFLVDRRRSASWKHSTVVLSKTLSHVSPEVQTKKPHAARHENEQPATGH